MHFAASRANSSNVVEQGVVRLASITDLSSDGVVASLSALETNRRFRHRVTPSALRYCARRAWSMLSDTSGGHLDAVTAFLSQPIPLRLQFIQRIDISLHGSDDNICIGPYPVANQVMLL